MLARPGKPGPSPPAPTGAESGSHQEPDLPDQAAAPRRFSVGRLATGSPGPPRNDALRGRKNRHVALGSSIQFYTSPLKYERPGPRLPPVELQSICAGKARRGWVTTSCL